MTAKFKTANIFVGAGITKTAKFNARQYFCVYGMSKFAIKLIISSVFDLLLIFRCSLIQI